MKNLKALAFDIDGTITDDQRLLCLDAVKAIREIEKRGIMTIVATGNVLPVAYTISEFIGSSGPVIAENGGVILFKDTFERVIVGNREKCLKVIEILEKEGITIERTLTDMCRLSEVTLVREVPVEVIKNVMLKYGIEGLNVIDTKFAIHITESCVNKGRALKIIMRRLGINPSEIAYIGDSENDVEAFQAVEYSVALANAPEWVKRRAKYVTSTPYGKGFIEALELLGIM
ncbi:MAG: phosphoglycolate phosphatase [Euryarchaeota archaeon]|nr:phosphoglycolate phosphatase [Euryarchaeota archaeon]